MTDADECELLLRYRPWLRKVAGGMCRAMPQWAEDCAAEGWIAMWRALITADGRSPIDTRLKYCATQRMATVVRDWYAQCRDIRRTDLYGDPATDDADVWRQMQQADLPEQIEHAYHDGAIAVALAGLSERDRDYVRRRFWGGETNAEMAATFGKYAPQGMWSSIRPRLAAQLDHLR